MTTPDLDGIEADLDKSDLYRTRDLEDDLRGTIAYARTLLDRAEKAEGELRRQKESP